MKDDIPVKRCSVVPYEGDKGSVFISYSHKDGERVYPIIERLSAEGYRVWYDEGIDPGSEWPETIAEHLSRSALCIGFISKNYLDSHNCRRELNFALMKKIPFLSVLLEEVEMSAGMEMQLSTNQAIFLYKLSDEESFYNKLRSTKAMQDAYEPPAGPAEEEKPAPEEIPAAAEAPVPAEKPAAKETPVQNPAASKTKKEKQPKAKKEKKPKKPVSKGKKIVRGILIALAALVLLFITLIVIELINNSRSTPAPSAPDARETLLCGDLGKQVFLGEKITESYTKNTFLSNMTFIDVQTASGLYNLSEFPFSIEARPQDPDVITLGYMDKVGAEHYVEGRFELTPASETTAVVTISPTDTVHNEQALRLAGEISYEASVYYNDLVLKAEETQKSMRYTATKQILSGKTADENPYNDLISVDISSVESDTDCTMRLANGAVTKNAKLFYASSSIAYVQIRWSEVERLYNGEMQTLSESGDIQFKYFNTYPYGFILFDTAVEHAYAYQSPVEGDAGSETESTQASSSGAEEGSQAADEALTDAPGN